QKVTGWVRTDVKYESQCEEKEIDTRNGYLASEKTPAQFRALRKFVKLPEFHPELAIELAKRFNIPIAPTEKSTGESPLKISNLSNGKTVTQTTQVVGNVTTASPKEWKLEIGKGGSPGEWTTIGSGTSPANGVLGVLDLKDLENGVYTVRLTVEETTPLSISVIINIKKSATPGNNENPDATVTRPPTFIPTPTGD
ncbi:MAG TPA: hypothetical protein VFY90_04320, partial [Tepidiformaceae bacterium]|nr:hypothetical protein [Tepidiformaceae bacterium]